MTPEAQREDIRELIVQGHRLLYWLSITQILIARVAASILRERSSGTR